MFSIGPEHLQDYHNLYESNALKWNAFYSILFIVYGEYLTLCMQFDGKHLSQENSCNFKELWQFLHLNLNRSASNMHFVHVLRPFQGQILWAIEDL